MNHLLMWTGFILLVIALLALDLKVFNREARGITIRESLLWTLFWIVVALGFNAFILLTQGFGQARDFLAAYLVEKSLSMDNLFVFLVIFQYFRVDAVYQHRVLFWGILGALVFRGIFIMAGTALMSRFHWIIYVFGAFLVFTGIRLLFEKEKEIRPDGNPAVRLFRKFLPVHPQFVGGRFFTKTGARWLATPLFVVVLVIESTDIVFAVDSIPAALGLSQDPFIVFTSNIMAVLGLRALFFALSGVMRLFRFLKYGLSLILVFVGLKMLASETILAVPSSAALLVIAGILAMSVVLSLVFPGVSPKNDGGCEVCQEK